MSKNTVQATGARAQISIGAESTFGEPVDPTHTFSFLSESISADEDVIESEAIRGDRGRHELIQGTLDVSGDVNWEQSASGFGMMIHHCLGDYIKVPNADGGVHARLEKDSAQSINSPDIDERAWLPFAPEHSGGFKETGGHVCFVDRTGVDNSLRLQDNSSSGYEFTSYTESAETHVDSVTQNDATHSGTTDALKLTLMSVLMPDGTWARPAVNDKGGTIEYGHDRNEVRYFEAADVNDSNGNPGKDIWIVQNDLAAGSSEVSAGDYVYSYAGIMYSETGVDHSNLPGTPTLGKGTWVYEFEASNYTGVFTHHIERGRYLPEGLTIEVDRDAAVFLYSGMKGSSITFSYETNSVLSATASLVGREEHAMGTLMEDVLPEDTEIYVKGVEAFPDPDSRTQMDEAIMTIGERTDILYTQKAKAGSGDGQGYETGDGVYKFTIKDNTQIDMMHPKGSNVDCRTSRIITDSSPIEPIDSPLTSFESLAYVNGHYEEVLSAEVTLENNLNTDKYGLGSRFRLAVVAEQADVSASLSMEFDDGKHYERFRSGDYFFLEVKTISENASEGEIGSTGVLSQAYLLLPKCKFDGETPQVGDRSFIEHDMPITAVVDDDYDTTDLTCILVNGSEWDVVDNRP